MKKWLFNPFIYIAGAKALLIGWGITLVTMAISFFSHAHFDGVIEMHTSGHAAPVMVYLIEQIIDWALAVLLFYPGGLLFSRSSIRFIDVAGTMALARWPMIFVSVIAFGIVSPDSDSVKVVLSHITPLSIALTFVCLIFSIWMIALMYNAFRLSCNMKGEKAAFVFIPTLLIAEIASHIILHKIYPHLI